MPRMFFVPERLAYTPTEAMAALGISRSLFYRLVGSGQLHTVKAGSRRLVPASAIAELLDGKAA
jgi:excisionase family DNA binding protein